jgi:hypothetical protein
MGLFKRLDELTGIKADFEDEMVKHRVGSGRRGQVEQGLSRASGARQDEILKLHKEKGVPFDQIGEHLDRTDRNRTGIRGNGRTGG